MHNPGSFTNLQLDPATQYFLYVGEVKSLPLCAYVGEALQRKLRKRAEWIAIVPDILDTYPQGKVVVLNPDAERLRREKGMRACCRPSARAFASAVSNQPEVHALVDRIVAVQGSLYVYTFESVPELTLTLRPGVKCLGPDPRIASRWNDKIFQYRSLVSVVPMPEFRVCASREEISRTAKGLWGGWGHGIFVTLPYSAAGGGSFLARSDEDVQRNLARLDPPVMLTRYLPHVLDPTVLAVAAGPDEIFIAATADQRIEDGNKFKGSVFPTILGPGAQGELKAHTRAVGRTLAASGYRGVFGCDYIVDREGGIHLVEVNARKQGTTMEMCCTLETMLPPGSPSLPEIEVAAVMEGGLPENAAELPDRMEGVCWATYNFKAEADLLTGGLELPTGDERAVFGSVVRDQACRAVHVFLEPVGCGKYVRRGTFVGRVAAIGHDPSSVGQKLEEGIRSLRATVAEVLNDE